MDFYYLYPHTAIIFGSLIGLLSVIGIFGNCLVIVAVLGSAEMRRKGVNIFLVNLALADLLFVMANALAWLPRIIARTAEWVLPAAFCPAVDFALHSALYVSIFTYMGISVERYMAIVHPMSKPHLSGGRVGRRVENKQRRHIIITCVAIWMLMAVWWAPNAYMTRAWSTARLGLNNTIIVVPMCGLRWSLLFHSPSGYDAYNWVLRVVAWGLYVFAVNISVVLYWRICRALWTCDDLIDSAKLQSRRGIVKMLIVCVVFFLTCYTAMLAISVATILHAPFTNRLYVKFFLVMTNVAMSTANPYIYTLFSSKFRHRFIEILQPALRGAKLARNRADAKASSGTIPSASSSNKKSSSAPSLTSATHLNIY